MEAVEQEADNIVLQWAYEEWRGLPMPSFNPNHLHDTPKPELEEAAIRGQIKWVAQKYGVTFRALDNYIEEKSNERVQV